VEAKFGVGPERVVDVQALAGDSVDNVPGAPGIGVKTAALLINEYGDLDTLLDRAEEIKQPKRRQTLIEQADQIRCRAALVTLDDDMPMAETLDDLEVRSPTPRSCWASWRDGVPHADQAHRRRAGRRGAGDPRPTRRGGGAPGERAPEFPADRPRRLRDRARHGERLQGWIDRPTRAAVWPSTPRRPGSTR
jgi:DNA polymerase-1